MHLCFAGFMMHFIQLGVGGMGGERKKLDLRVHVRGVRHSIP